MENNSLIEIMKEISKKLDGFDYAFIGSANLYLQGLDITPRDIDIISMPSEIRGIDEVLSDYRIEEVYFDESEGRNSFLGRYKISGMEIEILGNVLNSCRKRDEIDEKIFVKKNGNVFPCISLENEMYAYSKMKRLKKAEMIRKFLEK